MSSIKKSNSKNFKTNCIKEMVTMLGSLKNKIKNDEDLTDKEVEDAKTIFIDNLNKIVELNSENLKTHSAYDEEY